MANNKEHLGVKGRERPRVHVSAIRGIRQKENIFLMFINREKHPEYNK